MPIKLPNLDDRTFADLVREAQTLIHAHAPEWTNHNESDPGITFVEMFAYLTEMLIYRLNRVTDANRCAFLRLIDGIERRPSEQNRGMVWRYIDDKPEAEIALDDEVRRVVLGLRQQDRAVTCEDFERLALAADSRVKRAYCVPQRDLTSDKPYEKANAYISVVILSSEGDLRETVRQYLEPRRLLTTRVSVVNPRFVKIRVQASLSLNPDAIGETVNEEVKDRLSQFFKRERWPFGRNVYVSEIYRLLDRVAGVDFVTKVKDTKGRPGEILTAPDDARNERVILQDGELVAIKLNPDELVDFDKDKDASIAIVSTTEKGVEE